MSRLPIVQALCSGPVRRGIGAEGRHLDRLRRRRRQPSARTPSNQRAAQSTVAVARSAGEPRPSDRVARRAVGVAGAMPGSAPAVASPNNRVRAPSLCTSVVRAFIRRADRPSDRAGVQRSRRAGRISFSPLSARRARRQTVTDGSSESAFPTSRGPRATAVRCLCRSCGVAGSQRDVAGRSAVRFGAGSSRRGPSWWSALSNQRPGAGRTRQATPSSLPSRRSSCTE
ncbi:hypothetical protein APR12_005452 [Nocardia amikacinitolerans]|nr:hypothetical protein [Nocardia amikacinitolerans]